MPSSATRLLLKVLLGRRVASGGLSAPRLGTGTPTRARDFGCEEGTLLPPVLSGDFPPRGSTAAHSQYSERGSATFARVALRGGNF